MGAKALAVVAFLLVAPFLLSPALSVQLTVTNVEPSRFFTPTAWFLVSNRTGVVARDVSLVLTGTDTTAVSVTVANTGTSSYYYFVVIVGVYNSSGSLLAYGYDIFFSFWNPLSPGETYTTTITLNTAVPAQDTAYVLVQVR